jgi:hypothetical protein
MLRTPSWNGTHDGSLHPRHRVASDRLRQINHPARYPRRPHLGEPRRTPAVADRFISLRAYSRKLDGALGEVNKAGNIGDARKQEAGDAA